MKELRIGLVLYGGVSLAVYMNGIVTELWHTLRASRAHHGGGEGGAGTAAVYAELLERLERMPGAEALRVVVRRRGRNLGRRRQRRGARQGGGRGRRRRRAAPRVHAPLR